MQHLNSHICILLRQSFLPLARDILESVNCLYFVEDPIYRNILEHRTSFLLVQFLQRPQHTMGNPSHRGLYRSSLLHLDLHHSFLFSMSLLHLSSSNNDGSSKPLLLFRSMSSSHGNKCLNRGTINMLTSLLFLRISQDSFSLYQTLLHRK